MCGSAPTTAPATVICCHNAVETVMALPPKPNENGATIATCKWPMPSVDATAMGPSMCAASKWPTTTRSRMFAHEVSRTSVRSMPASAAKPFSAATISGAQSSSGMKPMTTTPPLTGTFT
jgi:hypothetical protein